MKHRHAVFPALAALTFASACVGDAVAPAEVSPDASADAATTNDGGSPDTGVPPSDAGAPTFPLGTCIVHLVGDETAGEPGASVATWVSSCPGTTTPFKATGAAPVVGQALGGHRTVSFGDATPLVAAALALPKTSSVFAVIRLGTAANGPGRVLVTGAPAANDAPPADYLQLALNTAVEPTLRKARFTHVVNCMGWSQTRDCAVGAEAVIPDFVAPTGAFSVAGRLDGTSILVAAAAASQSSPIKTLARTAGVTIGASYGVPAAGTTAPIVGSGIRGDVAELVIGDNVTGDEARALSAYFSQKYGPTTAFVVE